MTKQHRPLAAYILAVGLFLCGSALQAAEMGETLYKRLGGYDAIAAVSDDFIGRLAADKQLNRFLVGLSADSQKKLRQHVVDQLCEATGGPCKYSGKSMPEAHKGMLNVRNRSFDVFWTTTLGVSLLVLAAVVPPGSGN